MQKDARAGQKKRDKRKPWQGAKPHGGGRSGGRGGAGPTSGVAAGDDSLVRIFGSHAVEAALRNPQRGVRRLLATENAERRLAEILAARPVEIDRATPLDLDRILGADTVHQGLLLEADPLPEPTLDDLAAAARTSLAPLILLDHVTDPHNVGAVLRSAAAFGAAGLVMTQRHSPPLNGVLAKAASGALDLVPVLLVQNLARAMLTLKEHGFVLLGLDGTAAVRIEDESFDTPTAIVLGAEGRGLRELTAETCDRLVRIMTAGPLASLNVSNAAAVALHTAQVKRSSG